MRSFRRGAELAVRVAPFVLFVVFARTGSRVAFEGVIFTSWLNVAMDTAPFLKREWARLKTLEREPTVLDIKWTLMFSMATVVVVAIFLII